MAGLLIRDPFVSSPLRLMDEILRAGGNGRGATGFTPTLDVRETPEEYLIMVDLPGVKPEDVAIELHDQVLTVSGTRVSVESGEAQLVERPYGSFVRSLTLPQGVDSDKIAADYSDGVLAVHVPKPPQQRPKKISIGGSHPQIER